ncbi:bifunctional proline dehydrogenase/L-glutamate gamma-semialdehyde dehydrogenase PutA [Thiocapsa roseopersicina]|uniref:Bifunctional protein PutA n=1 Tax=Thiocapsa roseopersicina TaxID=1058 RepID=A0A1H2TYW1_THIRO|nr:bifunctional proline dehydrogenase/L-glutamate gamma-semialdehyde dehydrogenase PutA [Thiocapsa roseopersicina]SDW48958.1 L-proline dehydrogenase /delta-1-pyrroline-5-carboxylate dehydrogenase [Thiocapsa roseopersicina]
MFVSESLAEPDPPRAAIDALTRADEAACVQACFADLDLGADALQRIDTTARRLVEAVRLGGGQAGGLDAFLQEYGLSTPEGVTLMCIAEALLRIPDTGTRERLIQDKLAPADWDRHLGHSQSLLVNASTLALMLTGRVVAFGRTEDGSAGSLIGRLVGRLGEPVVREALGQAMRILALQFVMGSRIEEALERARTGEAKGYTYSYDMLGEAACTAEDAERYYGAYREAIRAIGTAAKRRGPVAGPGISVKLSALHPRYEAAQRGRVMAELLPRLLALARAAAERDIGLTIDAEEADRLDLSLELIAALAGDPALGDWRGLGVAVQAYQKRAPAVIDWLGALAGRHRCRLMVRLVKGAYWDTEIKRAQEGGQAGYPVFTRKAATDVSYLACARRLLARADRLYPQFATHNAHTIAAVLELAGTTRGFEFQRLHGMGEALYQRVVEDADLGVGCRIYAPVGRHEDLLPYLVRRLLENGANSSFVNRLRDERLPIAAIVRDPIAQMRSHAGQPHPRIPLPRAILLPERTIARGLDLASPGELLRLREAMSAADGPWTAAPIIDGMMAEAGLRPVVSPADRTREIGGVRDADPAEIERALVLAATAAPAWAARDPEERAACLERAADALEADLPAFMALAVREAGKTLPDALAEVREAVDFCRYYAARARAGLGPELSVQESASGHTASVEGGGVFVCISPWNFPLAIFIGQVSAALVAGNAVLAKPAEQTPLIAARTVRLLHEAGVPGAVLHLLPGEGARVGAALVTDPRIAGVCFTGSTEVARSINRQLAGRSDRRRVLIAETGGINAMIVDSTALTEQVIRDVLSGAFRSAGQRCSALRLLFLQEDIAEHTLDMLAGAMDELRLGDPGLLDTDVGPVIDGDAAAMLEAHARRMEREARLIRRVAPGPGTEHGWFVAPAAFELEHAGQLEREVFGPLLHVVRFAPDTLDAVVDSINAKGYGLTLGVHTRIDATWRRIAARARVGNIYINRNQIGALVGIQPFGGRGLSGTGPKAGGPYHLERLVAARPAVGVSGNASQVGTDVGRADPFQGGDAPVSAAPTGLSRRDLEDALSRPDDAQPPDLETRATILERAATRIGGAAGATLVGLAARARAMLAAPLALAGPTGEENQLFLEPLGRLACVADDPAVLAAQIGAALVTGNRVIAVGPGVHRAVQHFIDAGAPIALLALIPPGTDADLEDLAADPRLDGLAFQGEEALAARLDAALARSEGPIRPLIPWVDVGADVGAGIGIPPAGSPGWIRRFLTEKTLSRDTTASGGNASLLAAADDEGG